MPARREEQRRLLERVNCDLEDVSDSLCVYLLRRPRLLDSARERAGSMRVASGTSLRREFHGLLTAIWVLLHDDIAILCGEPEAAVSSVHRRLLQR